MNLCILIYIFLASYSLSPEEVGGKESTVTVTLQQAIDRALEYNDGILATMATIKQAEAGVTIARAGFLPRISVQGSYTRLAELPTMKMEVPEYGMLNVPVFGPVGDTIGFTVVPGIIGTNIMEHQMGEIENYLTRLSLEQPIFTGGRILDGYRISKLNLDAIREDYRKEKNELVFNVNQSFYGILVLEKLVELMQDTYRQIEDHVKVVEKRYNAGLASNFDLLRTRVQLKNIEPEVIRVKNALELTKIGFKMLLGLSQDTTIDLQGDLKYEPIEIDLTESLKEASLNRPEIKALKLRKEMAGKALAIAKRANWPNVALVANYDYKRPLYFEDRWGTEWNLTLALRMPIFTGFRNRGEIREAVYQLSQIEHILNLLKEGIEMEVRRAHLQIEEAEKIVESQKENIRLAEEALSIVEERYKQGLATSLEVMDTQVALRRAKTNWLQSLSDYLIAKAKLEKAIGM